MKMANVYSLALLPLAALLWVAYLRVWGFGAFDSMFDFENVTSALLVWLMAVPLGLIAGTVVHELLHGFSFLYLGGASRESVTLIGFQRETATPYSSCSEPLRASGYRWTVAAPGLVLGVLPTAVGLFSGNPWVMFFGTFFLLAASGDAVILWLLRGVPANALVEDHPTRAGCYVIPPEQTGTG